MLPFTYHFHKVQDVFLKLFIASMLPTELSFGAKERTEALLILEGAKSVMTEKYKPFYDTVAYCAAQTTDEKNTKMPLFAALLYLKQLLQKEPPSAVSFTPEESDLRRSLPPIVIEMFKHPPSDDAMYKYMVTLPSPVSIQKQQWLALMCKIELSSLAPTIQGTVQKFVDSITTVPWMLEATDRLEKWLLHNQEKLKAFEQPPEMLARFAEARLIAQTIATHLVNSPIKSSWGTIASVVDQCLTASSHQIGFIILPTVAKETGIALTYEHFHQANRPPASNQGNIPS